jgi:sialic acid synthase SpsE
MNKGSIRVGDRAIGSGYPVFLIAEGGTTAIGDLERAKRLTDMAKEAGFDAVKFQTIGADSNISDQNTLYRYKDVHGNMIEENMYEMFKNLAFMTDEWMEIADHARKQGIFFFSTVDYLEGVEVLEKCHVPLHKMGSWDVTYEPLIVRIAQTGKPLMVDLGPATLSDIVRLVDLHQKHGTGEVILLHDFHTEEFGEMNMSTIPFLQKALGMPVGFSAPGRNADLDVVALALGAHVIEKRITLSRADPGHHHAISLESGELKEWVNRIRSMEKCLGSFEVKPSTGDLTDADKYFRSICTLRDVKKGEAYSAGNLDAKRPGTGIPSRFLEWFYHRRAPRDLARNTLLTWEDL